LLAGNNHAERGIETTPRFEFLAGAQSNHHHLELRSDRLSQTITNANHKRKAQIKESRTQAMVPTIFSGRAILVKITAAAQTMRANKMSGQ
jgi:hypothetical protein